MKIKKKREKKRGKKRESQERLLQVSFVFDFPTNRLHYARAIFRNRKIEKSGID